MPYDLAPELNDTLRVLQLRAQWDVAFTGRGESSWSFVTDRNDTFDQKADLWDRWRVNIKPFWIARRPPEWHFTRVLIEDRFPGGSPPMEITIDEYGEAGDFSGAPVQLSPILTLYTDYRGRSYRGRTFWGQIRVEDLDGSNLSSGMWTALVHWADAMYDTFCAPSIFPADPRLCIVSRRHNGAPEPIGRYAPVIQLARKRYLALQRRRNRYYDS